jgi:AmmeMemoRadiSam system protein B
MAINLLTSPLTRAHGPNIPPLIPIMIGNTSAATERSLGKILAPYLADPTNAFVISSDFAHWGLRFRYTHYQPSTGDATSLRASSKPPADPEIHESIKKVDFECIGACESGSHQAWLDVLSETGNTVCGRHPIGVVMAGLEGLREDGGGGGEEGLFKFLCYERSGEVKQVSESSVSYASAFAVV